MKNLILTVMMIVAITECCWGQLPQSVEKGRIQTRDGFSQEFVSLKLEGDQYLVQSRKESTRMPTEEIMRIDRQSGSEALLWGGAMGGAALLGSLLGVNSAENTTGIEADSDSKAAIVIGLTGLGVAIGVLVGSKQKKYETIYSRDSSYEGARWQLQVKPQPYSAGLTLAYRF
ncbi:MAG: hypothetical protein OER04_13150 [Cyclobacteriaceae bacterium]|nr:hypothetical protein [Cyclobacteriaceae bacterium]